MVAAPGSSSSLGHTTASLVLMGVVLWAVSALLTPLFGLGGWRWLALLALLAAGTVAYALSGQLLGAFRLSEFKEAMRR